MKNSFKVFGTYMMFFFLGLCFAWPSSAPAAVQSVGPICMTVSDMNKSVHFYSKVLTFKKISDRELRNAHEVMIRLGQEEIELVQYISPKGQAHCS